MLRGVFRRVALGFQVWALVGAACLAPGRVYGASDNVVVDFGEAAPTAALTPTPVVTPAASAVATSTPAPVKPSPTVVSKPSPSKERESVQPTPVPSPSVEPTRNAAAADEKDEGVIILSPGGASPEDSLAAFGIESPFETMKNLRSPMGGPAVGANEEEGAGVALELAAPETTDFGEKVSVMTEEGKPVKGLDQYTVAERAGEIDSDEEARIDGTIVQEKNGRNIIVFGQTVYLRMEEGRQVYPGSEYIVFREDGQVERPSDRKTMGTLVEVGGIIKITRVEGEYIQARVVQIYDKIHPGDKAKLRDPVKLAYLSAVRQSHDVSGDLNGAVIAIKGRLANANAGDIVYMDFGRVQGAVPGLRLTAYRPLDEAPSGEMAWAEESKVVGNLGLVEVISTQKSTSTGRVVRAGSPLKAGDRLRFR